MFKKVCVWVLLSVFLGQSTLAFAAPQGTPSVRQSRQNAQQAVQQKQQSAGVSAVKAVSAVVAGVLLTAGVQQLRINLLKGEKKLVEKELLSLREDLSSLVKDVKQVKVEQEMKEMKYFRAEHELNMVKAKNKDLQASLRQMNDYNTQLKEQIQILNRFFVQADVGKYAALYGKPAEEIRPLIKKMLEEDFAKGTTRIAPADIRVLAQRLEYILTTMPPEMASLSAWRASFSPRNVSNFWANLSKSLSAKNLLVCGLIVGSGLLAAENDHLSRQLDRLLQNPSLLLSLTDEQADMLDQSPAARAVCSVIAQAYQDVSNLPQQDFNALVRAARPLPQQVPTGVLSR